MVRPSLGFSSFQDVHTWRIWYMGHCGYQFLDHWGFLWHSGLSWWKYMALLREVCLMGNYYPIYSNRRPPISLKRIQYSAHTQKASPSATAGDFFDKEGEKKLLYPLIEGV